MTLYAFFGKQIRSLFENLENQVVKIIALESQTSAKIYFAMDFFSIFR
jgi:hypothetical protein